MRRNPGADRNRKTKPTGICCLAKADQPAAVLV